jgi:hypothetical protein
MLTPSPYAAGGEWENSLVAVALLKLYWPLSYGAPKRGLVEKDGFMWKDSNVAGGRGRGEYAGCSRCGEAYADRYGAAEMGSGISAGVSTTSG